MAPAGPPPAPPGAIHRRETLPWSIAHPSPHDALLLADRDLRELRVVTDDFHYKLQVSQPGRSRGIVSAWEAERDRYEEEHSRKLQKQVADGRLSNAEARAILDASQDLHQHQAWESIHRRFGLSYQRSRRYAKNPRGLDTGR